MGLGSLQKGSHAARERDTCGILLRTRRGLAVRNRPCVRPIFHKGKHRYRAVDVRVDREAPGFFSLVLRTKAARTWSSKHVDAAVDSDVIHVDDTRMAQDIAEAMQRAGLCVV